MGALESSITAKGATSGGNKRRLDVSHHKVRVHAVQRVSYRVQKRVTAHIYLRYQRRFRGAIPSIVGTLLLGNIQLAAANQKR